MFISEPQALSDLFVTPGINSKIFGMLKGVNRLNSSESIIQTPPGIMSMGVSKPRAEIIIGFRLTISSVFVLAPYVTKVVTAKVKTNTIFLITLHPMFVSYLKGYY
jgi:hypothetical protein